MKIPFRIPIKIFLFILLVILFKKLRHRKVKPLDTDIILAPGGYKGIYMIGICHYLKNHFPTSTKSMVGFSCGSFNLLFMRLDPKLDHVYLRCLFSLEETKKLPMPNFVSTVIKTLKRNFVYEDFDFRQSSTSIGVTTTKGLEMFQDFSTFDDMLDCCMSSSFIPFVTRNDLFLIYKNKLTLDGGIFYKKLKKYKKKETLLITSSMFGRFNETLIQGIKKPKCSYYQLYLNGYHDARKHHDYLASYFETGSGS